MPLREGRLSHYYRGDRLPYKGQVTDLVIDSTGLKAFGEGEWKVRKHCAEKRRVWRKLHLAVDPATHDILAAEMSLDNVYDAEVLPTLLNPLRLKLEHVYVDGAYDSKASHQFISRKGATACFPPRKSAGLWKKEHPRNDAVLVMRKEGLTYWKKISGYHHRSLAETAMNLFQRLLAGKISNCQVGEVMAYASAINKPNTQDLPVKKPRVSRSTRAALVGGGGSCGQQRSVRALQRDPHSQYLRGLHTMGISAQLSITILSGQKYLHLGEQIHCIT